MEESSETALVDDAIGEILLRLPPADPACLFRASLVCKAWRRLLSDCAFLRRYRAFHRKPPMLGFFNKNHDGRTTPAFVPVVAQAYPYPPPPILKPYGASAAETLDCRHGRVLLQSWTPSLRLTVWDPITGDHQSFFSAQGMHFDVAAAVLCASDGCDHLHCSGGPFLVVMAGVASRNRDDGMAGMALCSVYLSETAAWSALTSTPLRWSFNNLDMMPSLLAGGTLYFIVGGGVEILKYNLATGVLSEISMPPTNERNQCLVAAEDGGLGVAAVEGNSLHLWWLQQTDGDGLGEWEHARVIELEAIMSTGLGGPLHWLDVVGFAEGTDTMFIMANYDIIFGVELVSGRIRKICDIGYIQCSIFPFMSFYTPGTSIMPIYTIPQFVICQYLFRLL
ncbi:hypothetical protein U9M48_011492 [Paspalum notatum var. saurae]|uniref:F-box domain-containing protein n=1 Tax=Paspalum notatum var. saurae TaxID=547442 RepID=A0AAQ3SWE2_PASNO